jgi:hypothetical protein
MSERPSLFIKYPPGGTLEKYPNIPKESLSSGKYSAIGKEIFDVFSGKTGDCRR